MISTRTLARTGGLLYLAVAVGGTFSELFVRSSVKVAGDAAATAANIVQHAALFQAGFVADLVDFVCFLGAGLVLYMLLKDVNPQVALSMLVVNAVSVAMQALNMLNHLGALLVATDPQYTGGMSPAAAHGLVQLLLELHHQGYLISQIFFGLFLLPLGYLVFKSGYFPRPLGIALMVGSAGYIADVAAVFTSPGLESGVGLYFALAGGLAELSFVLWLVVVGARVKA